jgi:hypothetical protein
VQNGSGNAAVLGGERDLNFRVTQISDCAVISAARSPAGLTTLVHHCYRVAFRLLLLDSLCRRYITHGKIIHTDTQFFGTGYIHAYENERKVSVFHTGKAVGPQLLASALASDAPTLSPSVWRLAAVLLPKLQLASSAML